jgi:hypothetical protein
LRKGAKKMLRNAVALCALRESSSSKQVQLKLKGKEMQATINFAQNDARLIKRFGIRTATLLPALLICLLVLMAHGMAVAQTMSHPTDAAAPSDAQKAFEKMKTLVGSWQGTVMGRPVNVTIRVTSNGNAILHEATASGIPDNPITMFYVDGDRLLATHYCDAGNRPRWEGKMSPDGKTIEFSFVDVAGSTQKGYMSHAVFTIIDADHHTAELTYTRPGNKSLQARGELTRTK